MRNPIVVTTLEEDFRKIGLIKESAPAAAEAQADDEEILEKRKTLAQRLARKHKAGSVRGMAKRPKLADLDTAGELAMRRRKAASHRHKTATQTAKRAKSAHGKKLAKVASRREGVEVDANETLKSFANAAIIADKLAGIFTEWVKADEYEAADERMFAGLAGQLGEIAESFADIATAMSEGRLDESAEDVAAAFAEGMEVILDCVDLYEDNNDGEEEDEEEVEETSGND
jgi:hypothetical protein